MNNASNLSALLLALSIAAPSYAQGELHFLTTNLGHVHYGASVAGVGDVDQDGFDDVAIGAALDVGGVEIRSGRDAAVIRSWSFGGTFGWSVAAPGDLDHDGVPDVIAGTLSDLSGGTVRALSAQSGAMLWTVTGSSLASVGLGRAIAVVDDLDADGVDDVAAAALGRVVLLSGQSGGILYSFTTPMTEIRLAGGGDVDHDGVGDFMVGLPQVGGARVEVRSGANGSVLHSFVFATAPNASVGIAILDDIDHDGAAEFAIGEPAYQSAGRVRVFSGLAGALLHSIPGGVTNGEFGSTLARLPDVNFDGVGDLLVAAVRDVAFPGAIESPSVTLVSGATGATISKVFGEIASGFGAALSNAGDVNADGRPDFVVGAYHGSADGAFGDVANAPGHVRVFSTVCGGTLSLSAACSGTGGFKPKLELDGCAVPGGYVQLEIAGGLGGAIGVLFFGTSFQNQPLPGGCSFGIGPIGQTFVPFALGGTGPGNGSLIAAGNIPLNTPLGSFYTQAVIVDPNGAAGGVSATNTLRVNVL